MFLLLAAAFASDHGIQRIFDREVECAYQVDPQPDPSTCRVQERRKTADDERPTWAISVAPPGKLFVSSHMAEIDWARADMVQIPRAFEPILLSVGLKPEDPACPGEQLEFAHIASERGTVTQQYCAAPPWEGEGEVLLESHADLPADRWIPVWGHHPTDPEAAKDLDTWFLVLVYISMDGSKPERPPQHPYPSELVLRASIPGATLPASP